MLALPTTEDYAQEFTCSLGGKSYTFGLYYNTVSNGWFLDVKEQLSTFEVRGVGVVLGVDLMRPYIGFNGHLFCVSFVNNKDPTDGAFPNRYGLYWSPTL